MQLVKIAILNSVDGTLYPTPNLRPVVVIWELCVR